MKRIFIVDDDRRVVKMLEEYIKFYNFKTIYAGSKRDAL